MEFFKIRRTIPFMRHALVFNVISFVTFLAAVFFLWQKGLHLSVEERAPDGLAVNPPADVERGPFGSIRLRHFGPRPLLEDNSVKSKATSIVNGEVGYQFTRRVRLVAEGFNLFNSKVSDIDYFFESRLQNEPEAVEDIHFHAAIPRSGRVALRVSF